MPGMRSKVRCEQGMLIFIPKTEIFVPFILQLRENKARTREIQQLQVRCSFTENGCPWTGILKDLKSHAISCEFADTLCPRGCGEFYAKKDEEDHFAVCTKQMVACEFCGKEIGQKGMKMHLKTCPLMIIDCPNRCGIKEKTREEVMFCF